MEDQLSFDDILGIDIPEKVSPESLAKKKAERILSAWSSRSSVSNRSAQQAVSVFTVYLLGGVTEADLKYVITHPKPMLKSSVKITDAILDKALSLIEKDRSCGRSATEIYHSWHEDHYEGRYTQPPGQIIKCLKDALYLDVDKDILVMAMNLMGKKSEVITSVSLQYALARAAKMTSDRINNAGAKADDVDDATQSEIFAARKLSLDGDEQEFFSGGFLEYTYTPQQKDDE